MSTYKRKNECFRCTSRRCYNRIVTSDGPVFDEIACVSHSNELCLYSDKILGNPGYLRTHITNTGGVRRGEEMRPFSA